MLYRIFVRHRLSPLVSTHAFYSQTARNPIAHNHPVNRNPTVNWRLAIPWTFKFFLAVLGISELSSYFFQRIYSVHCSSFSSFPHWQLFPTLSVQVLIKSLSVPSTLSVLSYSIVSSFHPSFHLQVSRSNYYDIISKFWTSSFLSSLEHHVDNINYVTFTFILHRPFPYLHLRISASHSEFLLRHAFKFKIIHHSEIKGKTYLRLTIFSSQT